MRISSRPGWQNQPLIRGRIHLRKPKTSSNNLQPRGGPYIFSGQFYDPGEGQTYQLSLHLHSDNQAEARTYLGATVDGAIGLGVSAATGELPVLDTVSYAVRAFIGKKHLGETVIWSRLDKPTTHCNA